MIKKPNFIFIIIISLFVLVEILFLKPSSTEENEEEPVVGMHTNIETLVQAQKEKDEVGYNIEGFHYASVEVERKDWEMYAKRAVLYDKSKVVLAEEAIIRTFDPQGEMTNIESKRAFYKVGSKELDLENDVKITFPDGFWVKTNRARYSAVTQKVLSDQPFYGESPSGGEGTVHIWGTGFIAGKTSREINILKESKVRVIQKKEVDVTEVRSDKARIDRITKEVFFSMQKPQSFVEATQGTLYVRSRRQNAVYDPSQKTVNYLIALEDVLIEEKDKQKAKNGLKYATCQKAEFLTQQDKILLSGFPSVYQEYDTLTGDLITVYRKKNLVEVNQANAYHEGQEE